jgi:hypothetical protein
MTLEERAELTRFLQLLEQAQAGQKDAEAQALIGEAVARQPDAAYLLVQRVMQLEHALVEAKREAVQPKASFMGDANSWGRAPVATQPTGRLAPVQMGQAPAAAQQPSRWGSGLMGTLAMTAGGVVAGTLLAQGIGSLMGNHAKPDQSAAPPGGGTLVETDYGAQSANEDGGYVADDFADSGDSGEVG